MPRRYYRRFRRRRFNGVATGLMKSLTGGTRDMNPQWFHFDGTQTANDTTLCKELALPVTRLPQRNRVVILELLKFHGVWLNGFNVAVANQDILIGLSTANYANAVNAYLDYPACFMSLKKQFAVVGAAGGLPTTNDFSYDFTDGAGHGLLVAADKIYFLIASSFTAQSNHVNCGLLYRFKAVSMTEYVGIVQGGQ